MHIISWNVAGLKQTVQRIHRNYSPKHATDDKKAPPSISLQEYMKRHDVDVFCLQEAKIPLQQLSSRSEPLGCSTVEGFESFWSCCTDKNKLGFNGVVTYAKTGTVRRADAFTLGSPDLDDQGRCIMTDHGNFVLFNVYVPASGGNSLTYKMKFLNALRRAMKREREIKPVILVGDLNISHRKLDRFWADRVIRVDEVLKDVATGRTDLERWKLDLAKSWDRIEATLRTKEVVEAQTTNSRTGAKYEKFRMRVTVKGVNVYLGCHESSRECCEYFYRFDECHYECPSTSEKMLAGEKNVVSIGILAELMSKIAGIEWDEALQRHISNTEDGVDLLSPTRQWLDNILLQDDMVDVFRHFYPTAKDRFTCWNQYTNRRYVNEGCRIDYTLVDKSILPLVQKGEESLRVNGSIYNPLGEEAALCAATANGMFQPVSFEGNGIIEASQVALDTQFGPKHSGMIYTPPSFSDHIGVSLLMSESICLWDLGLDENDRATRKSQPHKSQKSIASFFVTGGFSPTKSSVVPKRKKLLTMKEAKQLPVSSDYSAPSKFLQEEGSDLTSKRAKLSGAGDDVKTGSIRHYFQNSAL